MLRMPAVSIVLICLYAVTFADESEDDAIAKAKHLTEAAIHLRAAGREELADQLLNEAAELVQPANQQLEEKRSQAERLRDEIAELERKLERPTEIAIRVRLLSLPAENWPELKPAAAKGKPMKPAVVNDAWLKKLAALEEERAVKKHAETTLTTRCGSAASLENGGEFPVPVPNQNGAVTIQFREFGTRLNVLPVALGFERLKLQLVMEHSVQDMSHAVMLNGTVVPGLNKQKIQTDYESRLGQTTLICAFEIGDEVIFGLVTPDRSEAFLTPPGDQVPESENDPQ